MNTYLARFRTLTLICFIGISLAGGWGPYAHAAAAGGGYFYVATNGNDGWSGKLAAPNSSGTDGPFATLPRALQASRQAGTAPKSIALRNGYYYLSAPLVIEPQDSGLRLAAYENEGPIISGGQSITGWRETQLGGRTVWTAEVPQINSRAWSFHELWVNGARAIRARHPNTGYLAVAELLDKAKDWTQGHSRFRYKENDLPSVPTLTNAEVMVMTRWVESRLPIKSIDPAERVVSFTKRSVFELAPGDLYYAEGAVGFLDTPGEWALDTPARKVYYLPLPGERLDRVEAIAPVLTQLIRFEGKPDGEVIRDIQLRGLTFSHTEWCFPEGFQEMGAVVEPAPRAEVGGFAQAAIGVPAAVWAQGLHESSFEHCRFLNVGNYGLELGRGCVRNRVLRSEFAHLGAGGIKLGETSIRRQPAEIARDNEVAFCHIHNGGKMFHSAIGVWIGQSPGNRLLRNHIHDFYYTGISVGWTWGYDPSALATNTLVAFNHVHHIGVLTSGDGPTLSDMAGIYTLGRHTGSVIHNNLWHDVAGIRYGGWGIYFDEGTSGILATSNVVYRTTHGGFHQHYGATNTVVNNIFAFARDYQVQRSRAEPHISFTFRTNIVYFNSGVLYGSTWSGDRFVVDDNVLFDLRSGPEPSKQLGPDNWANWQKRGHDTRSVWADPLFVAPEKNDFRLQPDSPALKLGFKPINLEQVGNKP